MSFSRIAWNILASWAGVVFRGAAIFQILLGVKHQNFLGSFKYILEQCFYGNQHVAPFHPLGHYFDQAQL